MECITISKTTATDYWLALLYLAAVEERQGRDASHLRRHIHELEDALYPLAVTKAAVA